MRRAIQIQAELSQVHTIEDLSEVFESIASLRIAKIRNRVVASKEFFAELWQTYQGLRIDPKKRLARGERGNGRDVFMAITAEGKLGGSVDEQIIETMLADVKDPANTDVMVIGHHGLGQLQQRGTQPKQAFSMPASDTNFNVGDIITTLDAYRQISVFYQTYDSLRTQRIARIELISAVKALGEDVADEQAELVSSRDYIFEPDINKIADYMESVMLGVALIQVIMESKLAQYANRFNAMSRAKQRAGELTQEYRLQYYRAKRAEGDERLKEIVKASKLKEVQA